MIDELVKAIKKVESVREVINSGGERMHVGSNRLYIAVTSDVDIIVEHELGAYYSVWIQNHTEGEGCTVAQTMDVKNVANFCVAVFKLCGQTKK